MLSKLIIFDGERFYIFKSKVESTQVAIGGSLNYPFPQGMDIIYLPSLWFQQVWKSLKPSSDGILSLDDLSHSCENHSESISRWDSLNYPLCRQTKKLKV
jgi:hypothetical protein